MENQLLTINQIDSTCYLIRQLLTINLIRQTSISVLAVLSPAPSTKSSNHILINIGWKLMTGN